METTSPNLRPDYQNYKTYSMYDSDILIIRMNVDGRFLGAHNINMKDASVPLKLADNSAFVWNSYYVFGGQSFGFLTKKQNVTYDRIAPTTDSYLFRYNP